MVLFEQKETKGTEKKELLVLVHHGDTEVTENGFNLIGHKEAQKAQRRRFFLFVISVPFCGCSAWFSSV